MSNIDHDRLFKELLTNYFQEFMFFFIEVFSGAGHNDNHHITIF
ncbi:MAG: hypothetical protein ACOX1J_01150 [Dethiobacteria bacterium]